MNNGVAMRVTELTKRFGRKRALDNVSFDIPMNTVFGLLGPNGAGKTTLFSIAAGFLKPTEGDIEVLGIDVEQISELRGRLSILPQDALFQANIPIYEQLVFFGQLNGFSREDAREEAHRALKLVGLSDVERKNARILSHGMAKRLGIAQAFIGNPEVILLDEPTAGLDPVSARAIRDLVKQFVQQSSTIVISSHNLREIQEMCSHVAIIDKGKLVAHDSIANLTQSSMKIRISFARPLKTNEAAAIRQVSGITKITGDTENEYTLHMDLRAARRTQDEVIGEVMKKLLEAGLVPRSVSEGASLESRFLEVTGGLELVDE